MKQKRSKHAFRMLITIIAAMALIVSAWSIWFFPDASTDEANEMTFKSFTAGVLKSFSVFSPEPKAGDKVNKVNIDDLRSRVFGDAVTRD